MTRPSEQPADERPVEFWPTAAIRSARDRLVEPEQMGTLFKVMALAAPNWPDGAGFG